MDLVALINASSFVACTTVSTLSRRAVQPATISRLQGGRLRSLVKHAYETVPLYRKKYDQAGIKPDDIRSLADLHKLPVLTKNELKAGFPAEIVSRRVNRSRCYVVSTSGHTGSPVRLYRSQSEIKLFPLTFLISSLLMPLLFKRLTGVKVSRRATVIIPSDEQYDLYRAVKEVYRLPTFLRGCLQYIDGRDEPEKQLLALQRYRPDVIASDATAIRNIVATGSARGMAIPQCKLMFLGSELIDRVTRNIITQAFGCKIVEHYGSEEAGTIAVECPQGGGLHILWQSNLIEIMKDGRPVPPGEPGEVLVTNLWNVTTPIIRYSGMGDLAAISEIPCSCHWHGQLLKMIEGRVVDSFILPDGRMVHPFRLTLALEHIPKIVSYQIIQETVDHARVLIRPENVQAFSAFSDGGPLHARVIENLRGILGDQVQITVQPVDSIQASGSRQKWQPVRSLVNHPS